MSSRFSTEEISEYYEMILEHSEIGREWPEDGHRGIHVGYFDDEHDDFHSAVENLNRVVADAADIGEGDRVLDAGCGIGGPATWLANTRGAEVVALNISDVQLDRAREVAVERDATDRVEFRKDDYTEMETVEPGSFDVVMGLESICYANDKRDFLREAHRALEDDGRIVVVDGFMAERDLSPSDQKVMDKWLDGWRIPHLSHVDDFGEYVTEAGFEDVESEDIMENVAPTSKLLFKWALINYPIAKVLNLLGRKSDLEVEEFVSLYYQRKAVKRGLCTYALFTGRA